MAEEVNIPGSGESIDFGDLGGSSKSFAKAVLGFFIATAAGALAVKLYNMVARSTPDTIQQVDLI